MSQFDQQLPQGWKIWSENSEENSGPCDGSDPRWMRELDQIAGLGPKKTRSVPLKILAPLLLAAQQRNSAWLQDFADDAVVIDADLHEVLLAYQKIHNEPASKQIFGVQRGAAA